MAHTVKESEAVISQKIKHQICEAQVKAWDKRIGISSMKIYTMYFDLRADFDDEKDPDGFVKTSCQKILNSLGYCFYGVVRTDFVDYEYDAETIFMRMKD